MTPNITLLLPVKNGQLYIQESILNLSQIAGPADEILIIDDGSTDQTPALVKKSIQIDGRLRYIKSSGVGLVNALNLGIKESANEWIARCDVDDLYSEDRISLQKTYIRPEVSAIFTDYKFIGSDSNELGTMPGAINSHAVSVSLAKSQRTAHPSVMYRKTAVNDVGGYRTQDFPTEDLSLWLRMAKEGQLISVPEVLLSYRLSKDSVSGTKRKLIQTKSKEIVSKIGINYSNYIFVKENLGKIFEEYDQFSLPARRKILLLRELSIVSANPQRYGLLDQKSEILFKSIKHVLRKESLAEIFKLKKEKQARDRLRDSNHE
jgi:glycosyltransferase involved in cell wall biosynthesis